MDKDSRNTAEAIKGLPASGKQALSIFAAGFIAGAAVAQHGEEDKGQTENK